MTVTAQDGQHKLSNVTSEVHDKLPMKSCYGEDNSFLLYYTTSNYFAETFPPRRAADLDCNISRYIIYFQFSLWRNADAFVLKFVLCCSIQYQNVSGFWGPYVGSFRFILLKQQKSSVN